MCLYPQLIENSKYKSNEKNGGVIPRPTDERVLFVPVGCGKCMECKKKKANGWRVRLSEEVRSDKSGKFVALTFSDDSLKELCSRIEKNEVRAGRLLERSVNGLEGYNLDNEIATIAVRYFLERWRKKYKKSVKHWFVTELGQTKTERIHLHGIMWTNVDGVEMSKLWKYGILTIGKRKYFDGKQLDWNDLGYVGDDSVNYIVKYVHKQDLKHKNYLSKILTSSGIGKGYLDRSNAKGNVYNSEKTYEVYTARNGNKYSLPIYYRNSIYSDDERERLWLNMLDKEVRFVDGVEIDVSKGLDKYYEALEEARNKNVRLGFGNDEVNWSKRYYESGLRMLKYNNLKK
jgi:hypothetical protein